MASEAERAREFVEVMVATQDRLMRAMGLVITAAESNSLGTLRLEVSVSDDHDQQGAIESSNHEQFREAGAVAMRKCLAQDQRPLSARQELGPVQDANGDGHVAMWSNGDGKVHCTPGYSVVEGPSDLRLAMDHGEARAFAHIAARYPHSCPRCSGPAYVGAVEVDCAGGCK